MNHAFAADRITYERGAKPAAKGRATVTDDDVLKVSLAEDSVVQLPKKGDKDFKGKLESAAAELASLAYSKRMITGFGELTVTPQFDDKGEITSLRIEGKRAGPHSAFILSGVVRMEHRKYGVDQYEDKLMFSGKVSK